MCDSLQIYRIRGEKRVAITSELLMNMGLTDKIILT